ncbi:MAG TPA: hypothetical protein VFU43_08510 [Streptosporangiaceae bacterium]|nr:hypothetical protein [Streptosporangiaceae bacterium]
MHPYIIEALATERVSSLHEEAATRRRARAARRAARSRWVPPPERVVRPRGKPGWKPAA